MRINKIRWFVALTLALVCIGAGAQPFDKAVVRNQWNSGVNAAGIRLDSLNISYAELGVKLSSEEFLSAYSAKDNFSQQVSAETMVRKGRLSMKGAFGFENWRTNRLKGSVFTEPRYYPIDIIEYTISKKTRQTYHVNGGLATNFGEHWYIGSAIDFKSINYAKQKDIRHTNFRMEMSLNPSVIYKTGNLYLGLSYIYEKTAELIQAEQIGTNTDKTYYAFLDKGLEMGVKEVWNGSGVHLAEAGIDRLFARDHSNGAALQIGYGSVYADVEYRRRKGTIGEKGYDWYDFNGHGINAGLSAKWYSRSNKMHLLALDFSWKRLDNYENVIEKATEGGVTVPKKLGSNRILDQRALSIMPSYRFYGRRVDLKSWFGVDWEAVSAFNMYPNVYSRDVLTYNIGFSFNLHVRKIDIGSTSVYRFSDLSSLMHRTVPTDAVTTAEPYRDQWQHNRVAGYLYRNAFDHDVRLRYNFVSGALKGAYIEGQIWAGISIPRLTGETDVINVYLLAGAMLKVGYNF